MPETGKFSVALHFLVRMVNENLPKRYIAEQVPQRGCTDMSAKGKIVRLLSGLVLKRARVVEAAEVEGFKRLRVQGDVPHVAAGTKVQVLLPTDDMRTYTPIPSHDGMVLLGWTHAGGPGARYMAGVAVGDELAFVGPQRSLDLAPGPVVIVGDETSVAVAAAFEAERPGLVSAVIQADSNLSGAAASVGLRTIEVIRRADTAATAAAIRKRLSSTPQAAVALTGSAALIVAVREALRAEGHRTARTKTYWIAGRAGLD